jgi:hypothetical protein
VITYFAFVGSSAPSKKAVEGAKKKASLEDQVKRSTDFIYNKR